VANQIIGSQQNLSKNTKNQSLDQFLTFALAPEQQALLPTQQLLEIVKVNLSQLTAIAGISTSVMGVYNWRGDVIWVVDLASMLGYKPLYAQEYAQGKFQDKCHIIFVRSQDHVLGFAVSQVGQMIRCDTATIQTSGFSFTNPAMMKACRGYWLNGSNETFLVLDGDAIAQIAQTSSA
jgi:positive phototaxis protein PixI